MGRSLVKRGRFWYHAQTGGALRECSSNQVGTHNAITMQAFAPSMFGFQGTKYLHTLISVVVTRWNATQPSTIITYYNNYESRLKAVWIVFKQAASGLLLICSTHHLNRVLRLRCYGPYYLEHVCTRKYMQEVQDGINLMVLTTFRMIIQWNPFIRTPWNANISLNQDIVCGPSYIEGCTKLPLK